MAKKYEFDLSELSDTDQKKVKDLSKKSKEEKKAREQKKELQKDVNKIFADYCRKNGISSDSEALSPYEKKMLDFGKIAWNVLKDHGMQTNDPDSAISFLKACLNRG